MVDTALIARLNWVWEDPDVAFTGGDWVATDTVKLANLLNLKPASYARTETAAEADTELVVTFGAARRIDHVYLSNTNATDAGTVTIIADGDTIAADVDLVPTTHTPVGGYIPFGRQSATGKVPTDERGPNGVSCLVVLDEPVDVTELSLEFSDTANPDGYFQIANVWAGMSARPEFAPIAGAFTIGPVEESRRRRSLGGTLHARRLWLRRRVTAALEYSGADEALATWLETAMRVGGTQPILFSLLPPTHIAAVDQPRTTILGVLEEPTPVEHQAVDYWRWTISVVEL